MGMLFGHPWEWWLTEAAPGLGSIASIILIFWYARLFKETREQTRVAQAGYAPSLIADIRANGNAISVSITNQGEGVAKNINLKLTNTSEGNSTAYIVYFEDTLRPGYTFSKDGQNSGVTLSPAVFDVTRENPVPVPLLDYVHNVDGGYFKIEVFYTDIIEKQEYTETIREMSVSNLNSEDTLDFLNGKANISMSGVGPEISLLGPRHIDLTDRIQYLFANLVIFVRKDLLKTRGSTKFGRTYFGPAYKEQKSVHTITAE